MFFADIVDGNIVLNEHNAIEWIDISEISNYCFCPADIPIINKLQKEGKSYKKKENPT